MDLRMLGFADSGCEWSAGRNDGSDPNKIPCVGRRHHVEPCSIECTFKRQATGQSRRLVHDGRSLLEKPHWRNRAFSSIRPEHASNRPEQRSVSRHNIIVRM